MVSHSSEMKNVPSSEKRNVMDLRMARETRATEALKINEEQIRLLTLQNKSLIESLGHAEEENNAIQDEKMAIEEENQTLKEKNFEAQSQVQAASGELEKLKLETSDRDKQLEIMTEQNGELLRLLEAEEANNSRLSSECEEYKTRAREYREKNEMLEKLSMEHQDFTKKTTYEGHLKCEEVRLLKVEIEHLKNHSSELEMRTSVEIEALQEQLRVRKEKQYQLLEKLQAQEEARRQAEDQVSDMEEKVREQSAKISETETQLQIEINSKLTQLETNKKMTIDTEMLFTENKDLTEKNQRAEQTIMKMESEARDTGDQLREMAEKVFQLLERLKLAEIAKTRSMESLRKKEQEVLSLKKKNSHLIKESTKEGKMRVKVELEKKDLEEQIRSLKKHNIQLGQKCKEEGKLRVRSEEGLQEAQEKLKKLNGRISFLLNKLQSDEEAKIVQKEEIKKMESQLVALSQQLEETGKKAIDSQQQNQTLTTEINEKVEEIKELEIRLDTCQKILDEHDQDQKTKKKASEEKATDEHERRLVGGRLRFFVDNKPSLGIILIKGKCAKDREWLEAEGCNSFLRRAMKSQNPTDMLVNRISEMYGTAMSSEEELSAVQNQMKVKEQEISVLRQKNGQLYQMVSVEEESKRKTLIRYVNAVKASVSLGEPGCEKHREEVGGIGAGRIHLPEACLTDEEIHAITATLRNNVTVVELDLRRNKISDEGANCIASILSGRTALKLIDLRGNNISRKGLKYLADALERSSRVRHVYVHAGGKIEALGTCEGATQSSSESDNLRSNLHNIQNEGIENNELDQPMVSIQTICVIDVRDNKPKEKNTISLHPVSSPAKKSLSKNTQGSRNTSESDASHHHNNSIRTIQKKNSKDSQNAKKQRAKQQQQNLIEKENLQRERGWRGRSGGLDVSINSHRTNKTPLSSPMHSRKKKNKNVDLTHITGDQKGFPPVRPSSAPHSNKIMELGGPPVSPTTSSEKKLAAKT